jgi:enoyl-CoA hydratase/carnithine racemase
MHAALLAWETDAAVKAVVVRGTGGKAFCAGGDIKALYLAARAGEAIHETFFTTEYPVNHLIAEYRKPYVALMDGITMGGGMGISQFASTRVVTERSRLGMPETGIGLIPDVGGTYFLSRMPGEIGTYLALTGAPVTLSDALLAGLADVYLPSGEISRFDAMLDTLEWGEDPAATLRAGIRKVTDSPTFGSNLMAFAPVIDEHFRHNEVMAILASLTTESRPRYEAWAKETLATLRKRSPLSMAVTLEALRRGRVQSLAACLRMELDLVMNCFDSGDIHEGIRAVLVDKDHDPKWNPGRSEDLAFSRVLGFFERKWPNGHPLRDLVSTT